MPPLPRRASRAALAILVLAAGVADAACQRTIVDGAHTGGSGGAACATFPTAGVPCSQAGLTCSTTNGDQYDFAVCYHGTWNDRSCLGTACGCPDTLPTAGATCDPCCGQPCPYLDDAGVGPTAACAPDGTWTVTGPG